MDHKLIFSQVLIYKQNEMHSTGFVPCGVHLIFEIKLIKSYIVVCPYLDI